MNIAGLHLQRVVDRRIEQAHHRAVIAADALQRQGQCGRVIGALDRVIERERIERAHILLARGQVGRQVANTGQRPAVVHGGASAHALVDAAAGSCVQRVGDHEQQARALPEAYA